MNIYKFLPDDVLLRLIKRSDQQAFSTIYDRHWERLFATAYRHIRDVPTCEDVVHDVFLSFWKNRMSSDIRALGPYLASAIKFQTITVLRKKIRETVVENHEDVAQLTLQDPDMDPSELLHQRYMMDILQERLRDLPPRCQLIFRLSRLEHMRNQEIAQQLAISQRTVENQLSKAMRHLRPFFKH